MITHVLFPFLDLFPFSTSIHASRDLYSSARKQIKNLNDENNQIWYFLVLAFAPVFQFNLFLNSLIIAKKKTNMLTPFQKSHELFDFLKLN